MCNLRGDSARQLQRQQEQRQRQRQRRTANNLCVANFRQKTIDSVWLDNLCIDLENGSNKWPRNGAHMHLYENDMEKLCTRTLQKHKKKNRENFMFARAHTKENWPENWRYQQRQLAEHKTQLNSTAAQPTQKT